MVVVVHLNKQGYIDLPWLLISKLDVRAFNGGAVLLCGSQTRLNRCFFPELPT